jgi:hypothetical protein
VSLLKDPHGFILHPPTLEKQTDDPVAVRMVEQSQAIFPSRRVVSFVSNGSKLIQRND